MKIVKIRISMNLKSFSLSKKELKTYQFGIFFQNNDKFILFAWEKSAILVWYLSEWAISISVPKKAPKAISEMIWKRNMIEYIDHYYTMNDFCIRMILMLILILNCECTWKISEEQEQEKKKEKEKEIFCLNK